MDVGVDVGTTVTKAVAFDDDGRPVAEASRPTRLVRPGIGRFEHETAEIVASVNEVVGELAGTRGGPARRPGDHRAGRRPVAGRSGRYGGPPGDLVAGRAEQRDPRALDHRRCRRAGVPAIRQPDVPGRLRSAAGRRTRGRARRDRSRRDSGVLQGRRDAAAHRRSRDGRVGRVRAVPRPTHESVRRRGAEGDRSLGAEAPAGTGGAGRTSRRAARRLDRNGPRDQGLRRSVRPPGRSRRRRCLPSPAMPS